jgi:hypothetical protein
MLDKHPEHVSTLCRAGVFLDVYIVEIRTIWFQINFCVASQQYFHVYNIVSFKQVSLWLNIID